MTQLPVTNSSTAMEQILLLTKPAYHQHTWRWKPDDLPHLTKDLHTPPLDLANVWLQPHHQPTTHPPTTKLQYPRDSNDSLLCPVLSWNNQTPYVRVIPNN
jgi:hypothetical protein